MSFSPSRTGSRLRLHDTTHSPVGLWQFDGDLSDDSGNSLDLSVASGTAVYTSIGGIRFFYFDGSTYLSRVAAAGLQITGALTIEAIVCMRRGADDATNEYILSCGDNGETEITNTLYSVRTGNSTAEIQVFHEYGAGTNALHAFDNATIPDSAPCHLAVTRASNGTTYKLYIDGVLLDTEEATSAPTGGGDAFLTVGAQETGTSLAKMHIASLKIINSELTAAQVLAEARRTVL